MGKGFNQEKQTGTPLDHAEIVAIRHACQQYSRQAIIGATLYSTCEPCPMCLGAAYWAQVGRIVYANSIDDTASVGFADSGMFQEFIKPRHQRRIPVRQYRHKLAYRVLLDWQAQAAA